MTKDPRKGARPCAPTAWSIYSDYQSYEVQ
jgi:hypothetical protein